MHLAVSLSEREICLDNSAQPKWINGILEGKLVWIPLPSGNRDYRIERKYLTSQKDFFVWSSRRALIFNGTHRSLHLAKPLGLTRPFFLHRFCGPEEIYWSILPEIKKLNFNSRILTTQNNNFFETK